MYTDYLVTEGQAKDAVELLIFGQKMFPDNSLLKPHQNKIQEGVKEANQVQDTIPSE